MNASDQLDRLLRVVVWQEMNRLLESTARTNLWNLYFLSYLKRHSKSDLLV